MRARPKDSDLPARSRAWALAGRWVSMLPEDELRGLWKLIDEDPKHFTTQRLILGPCFRIIPPYR